MPTLQRSRPFTGALPGRLAGLGRPQRMPAVGSANGTTSPTIIMACGPPVDVVDGGTITLIDDGCTWEANPGSTSEGRLTLAVRNETDDCGAFRVNPPVSCVN